MRCYHILTPDDSESDYFLAITDGDVILQICTKSFDIIKTMPLIDTNAALSSAFMDGNRLLLSMSNSIIYYYDDWQDYPWPTKIFTGHKCSKFRSRVILSRFDSNILLAGSEDGKIYIWNIQSGRIVNCLSVHEGNAGMDLIEVSENEYVSSGFDGQCYKWSIPQ